MRLYEEDKAHQFLMGLNDNEFSSVRSQLLAQDSLPPLDKIFNVVIQEENHRKVMVQRDSNVETKAVFAVSVPRTVPNLQRPTCKHCSKTGHEKHNCFKIIGYPAGWVPRGGAHGRGRGRAIRGG